MHRMIKDKLPSALKMAAKKNTFCQAAIVCFMGGKHESHVIFWSIVSQNYHYTWPSVMYPVTMGDINPAELAMVFEMPIIVPA